MNTLNRTVVAPLSSAIIALLLAGVVVVGIDQIGPRLTDGQARLVPDGQVEVSVAGAPFAPATTQVLGRGDRVQVKVGRAILEFPGGAQAELRGGSAVGVAGGNEADLILEEGDLLVESRRGALEVDGEMALLSVTGVAKLRRAVSLVAGVYEGNVVLLKDEQQLGIPQYRQAAAAGTGVLPASVDPLRLEATDEWDRRMLPEVLDLDDKLNALGRGFEAELPPGRDTGPELFRQVVPGLGSAPLTPTFLAGRAPGENLIGLVLVALDDGEFDSRVRGIFGFRALGASWGLVAADRDLNPNPVLGNLQSALGAVQIASPLRPPSRSPIGGTIKGGNGGTAPNGTGPNAMGPITPTGPGSTRPGTTPPGSGGPTEPGPGPGSPPPTSPPPDRPSKRIDLPSTGTVLDPVLEPVVDPLEDLLSGVLDSLLGLTSTTPSTPASSPASVATGPAPAPSSGGGLLGGLTGSVGGVLGGLTATVGGLLGS